jgi:hypothetical protein
MSETFVVKSGGRSITSVFDEKAAAIWITVTTDGGGPMTAQDIMNGMDGAKHLFVTEKPIIALIPATGAFMVMLPGGEGLQVL